MADGTALLLEESLTGEATTVQMLRTVLDRVPVAVALLTPADNGRDFRYVYANPAHESLKPRIPVLGKTYGQVWPELSDLALPRFREVYRTGVSWVAQDAPLTVEIEPGKPETRYYTFELSRIVVDDTVVLLDRSLETTAQVGRLRALRDSERRFRTVMTASGDVVYRMSADWSIMRQLQGQEFLATTDEDNPRWLVEYIPEEDRETVLTAINEAVEAKSLFDLEHRVLRGDGSVGWTHSRAAPLLDESGQISEWFGFAHDITQRRQAEEWLRETAQRFREVLEASLDAVYRRDLRTDEYDYISPVIESITGFTPAEFAGLPIQDVLGRIHPDDVDIVKNALPLAQQSGVLTVEYRLRRKDGQFVWLADHATMTTDDQGRPAYITGVVRDISDSKRFESELTERARYAEALNRINEAVHSTLDFDQIMNRAVVEAARASGLDAAAIHLREHGRWRFAYSHGLPDEVASLELVDDQAPISMSVVESGRPLLVHDVASASDIDRSALSRFDVGALMAIPLIAKGEVFAILFAGCYGVDRRFDDLQVDFMTNVAATLSLALANARMYQAEHQVAETLQEAIRAIPDRVSGVAFAHSYHSAADAARVGGDFYDVFEIEHDKVGVLIGDVAGKGLEAAVLTSLLRDTIRAHSAEQAGPASILSLTNALVYRHSNLEAFATVFFAIMDRRDGRLLYCNAGHTTIAILRSNGEVVLLPATSSIVGAFSDTRFSEEETCLELGDVLFLYTDGLVEARHNGEFYGEQRLFDLLTAARDAEPGKMVGSVVDDVLEFTNGRLSDDTALLAVTRVDYGAETPASQQLEI